MSFATSVAGVIEYPSYSFPTAWQLPAICVPPESGWLVTSVLVPLGWSSVLYSLLCPTLFKFKKGNEKKKTGVGINLVWGDDTTANVCAPRRNRRGDCQCKRHFQILHNRQNYLPEKHYSCSPTASVAVCCFLSFRFCICL